MGNLRETGSEENGIPSKKIVLVAAALLFYGDRLFLAKRAEGRAFSGTWEFPGGKVETGESAETALRREIMEELGVEISDPHYVGDSWYQYPDRDVHILFFSTRCNSNKVNLRVHKAARWFEESELRQFFHDPGKEKIIPPDVEIVRRVATTGFQSFIPQK